MPKNTTGGGGPEEIADWQRHSLWQRLSLRHFK